MLRFEEAQYGFRWSDGVMGSDWYFPVYSCMYCLEKSTRALHIKATAKLLSFILFFTVLSHRIGLTVWTEQVVSRRNIFPDFQR